MAKMKAVLVYGPGDFRCEETEIPIVAEDDILIKIKAAGVCAADRKIYRGAVPWPLKYPFIPGHELFGEILEIGGKSQRKAMRVGDQVTAEPILPCRLCHYCLSGWYHLCINARYFGFTQPGGFAQYMALPAGALVHKVPDSIDALTGVFIEPLSCALYCIARAEVTFSDAVVLSGLGGIGLFIFQALKIKRPQKIIVTEVNRESLSWAEANGADLCLDALDEKVDQQVKEATGGLGASVFIEASGNPAGLALGLKALRKRGRMVVFGVYDQPASLDMTLVSDIKELTITGIHLSPGHFPAAIRFLEQKLIDVDPVLGKTFRLNEVEQAFQYGFKDRPTGKLVFLPQEE
jgi:erythritol/L-threitol dehydrogenase